MNLQQSSIEIEARALKKALQGLSKLVPYRVRLPVIGMVRVEAINAGSRGKPGIVALTTTDLDTWFTIRIAAHVANLPKGKKSAFLVPLKRLKEVVKTVRPKQATDLLKLRLVEAESGRANRTESVNLDDFPHPPTVSCRLNAIELTQEAISDLSKAMLCCSKKESFHTLRGCYLNPANGGQLAATDGKHLVCFRAPSLSAGSLKEPVILPNHKIWAWKGLTQNGGGDAPITCLRIALSKAGLSKTGRTPIFRFDGASRGEEISDMKMGWTLIGRCIEGNYPNYAQVVPDQSRYKSKLDFHPGDIGAIAQAIAQLPGKELPSRPIGLRFNSRTAGILYRETAKDAYRELGIPFDKKTGNDQKIAVNRDQFLKALRFGFDRLEVIDEASPVRISGNRGFMIVMPLRIDLPEAIPRLKSTIDTGQAGARLKSPTDKLSTTIPVKNRNSKPINNNNASNTNNASSRNSPCNVNHNGGPEEEQEEVHPLAKADRQIAEAKQALKHAARSLGDLSTTLKALRRQQRTADRELRTVRSSIRSLKNIRL